MAGNNITRAYQQPINVKDESISLVVNPASMNFVGAGVTGTVLGSDITETIPGETTLGTVTNVSSANADIGVATGTTTPVLTLNSGTSASQIVKLDGSAKLPAVDGSQLTNLPVPANMEVTTNKATDFSTVNNTLYPSVQATKTYADGLVAGLLDYRGSYDASGNTFPATGGSGTAGAILKGDSWVISVAGTLGGTAIQAGDMIIANVDTPGQTDGNWNKLNTNISYVPEDSANKVTSISGASTDVQYPSAKLLYDQLLAKSDIRMYSTVGGSVDAITATFSPAVTLADKTVVIIRSIGQNLTTTPTFAPDGLTARVITHFGGTALHANDMGPAGTCVFLMYDLANTRWELMNPIFTLDGLSDVAISSPAVDQFLKYNGASWVNATIPVGSAGPGVIFYNSSPTITATSTNNAIPIFSLSATPVTTAEQTVTGTSSGGTTNVMCAWRNGVLGRTTINAGVWEFSTYCSVDSNTGVSTLTRQIYSVLPQDGGVITVTTTGTGTSRTMTASGGTPFATTKIDASATNTTASFVSTPQGLYQITARTSDTVVTISTPTTYANETGVSMEVWKKLFGATTDEINNTAVTETAFQSVQPAFTITAAHKLGAISFFTSTSGPTRTLTIYYDGTTHNTHFHSPLVTLHNDLVGLQGGTANEYYHMTSAQATVLGNTSGTNTGDQTTSDDTTTDATMYPTWVTTTAGSLPQKVSSTKLTFNPSTGALSASQYLLGANNAIKVPSGSATSLIVGAGGGATITGLGNTAVGSGALNAVTSGTENVAVGYQALTASTGNENVAIGSSALKANLGGNYNMAIGRAAMYKNTTGYSNVAVGGTTMFETTGGTHNVAIGDSSLYNANNNYSVAIGSAALQSVTSGNNNVGIGYQVGSTTLTTGSGNILIGTSNAITTPTASTSNYLNIGGAITATGLGTTNAVTMPGTLNVTGAITGNLTGNASGSSGSCTGNSATATLASTVTVADTADTTCFVGLFEDATGSLGNKTDAGLTYNASTAALSATTFVGALTGTASGNLTSGGALGTPSSGTLTNCTGLPVAGITASTSTALGVGSIELGHASDTTIARVSAGVVSIEGVNIDTVSSTSTLTNKRITKRVGTTTSSATPTINTDNVDYYSLTAQTADITSFTTNLSGTPTDNQTLWISVTGTAARALTFGTSFEASTVALPTTTVSTNRLDMGFVWNSASNKWRIVAVA